VNSRVLVLAGVAALAVMLPFALNAAQLSTATFVVIAAIGATGLNILTGYAGQISLGHAAFLGVGAYTGAVLGADHGLSAFVWIPAAGVSAALLGLVVGPVALRLRGLYLAIVTLGLVFVAQHVFFNAEGLTGGPQGREFPAVELGSFDFSPGQVLNLGGVTIDSSGLYYFLALILLAAATAFAWNLRRTRAGRAMVALREREAAAGVMGIDVGRLKVTAFVVSAAMAGVSGALYASYLSFAQPGQWSLLLSIQFIAAIIVGGLGTTAGPILGCAVVFALPSLLKELPFLPEEGSGGLSAGDLTSITYGLLIVAFLSLEPRGLVGIANRLRRTGNGSGAGSRASTLTVTTPEEAHP
jgi:branched-chain amino acid transport system permease protein